MLRNALESAHHHRVAAAGRCCMCADQQTHRQTHRWSVSVSVEAWAVLARIQYRHSKRSLCALSLSLSPCVCELHILMKAKVSTVTHAVVEIVAIKDVCRFDEWSLVAGPPGARRLWKRSLKYISIQSRVGQGLGGILISRSYKRLF